MIEGLKIDVPGDELIAHIRSKADEHAAKAEQYAEQAEGVEKLQPATGQTNDPAGSLRNSQREHQSKADLFTFIADHLNKDVFYRLSEQDLIRVEIIMGRW